MSVVIDTSVTVGWIYDDERTAATGRVLERVTRESAWVPVIWRLEVANALQQGIRRHRIDRNFRDAALADLEALGIAVDNDTNTFAWNASLDLADEFRLTVYDACYLELAQRLGLPLATLDKDLRSAGKVLGLTLLGT